VGLVELHRSAFKGVACSGRTWCVIGAGAGDEDVEALAINEGNHARPGLRESLFDRGMWGFRE
jgi:hypothetical protein